MPLATVSAGSVRRRNQVAPPRPAEIAARGVDSQTYRFMASCRDLVATRREARQVPMR